MKKNILFGALMAMSVYSAQAQFKLGQDTRGTLYLSKHTDGFIGDAFLYKDWLKGHILYEDGSFVNNLTLKYDIYIDRIIFNSNENEPMAFKDPVKEFQIIHNKSTDEPFALFKNGFPPIGNYNSKSFYQVLTEGKTTLVKKPYKAIVESTPYGESELKRTFVANELYYLHHKGAMLKIQRNKNSLVLALGEKKTELLEFIKKEKLAMKSDGDYVAVVNYYNSL